MNKKSIAGAAAAVVALAYGGATWYAGEQARTSYEDIVQKAKDIFGPQAVLSHRYQRGFWVSEAQVVLQWTPPDTQAEGNGEGDGAPARTPVRVVVDSTVRHGPLAGARVAGAVVQTRFSADGMDDRARGMLARASAPTLTTVRHLTGGVELTFSLPAGELGTEGEAQVRWQAMTHQMNVNADRSEVSGTVAWPELTLSTVLAQAFAADGAEGGAQEDEEAPEENESESGNEDESDTGEGSDAAGPAATSRTTVAMKGLSGDFRMQLQDGLWMVGPGQINGRVQQIAMDRTQGQNPAQSVFSLQDLAYSTVLERTGETLGWTTRAQSPKASFGSLAFDALGLEEHTSRMDLEVLKRAQQALVAFYRVGPGQSAQTMASQWEETVQEVAPRFVAALPAYTMKMSGTLDGEHGEMEYGARIDAAPSADEVRLAGWTPAVLRASVLHANLRLPKAWLPRMAQAAGDRAVPGPQIGQWVGMAKAQGFVVEEGSLLVSAVQFKEGKLRLNGKELRLPGMPR